MSADKRQKTVQAIIEAQRKVCAEEMFEVLQQKVLDEIRERSNKKIIIFDIDRCYPADMRNDVLRYIVTTFSAVARVFAIYYKDYRGSPKFDGRIGYYYNVVPADHKDYPTDNQDGATMSPTMLVMEFGNQLVKRCFPNDSGFIDLELIGEMKACQN